MKNRNIIKILALLLFNLPWRNSNCQTINYSTNEGYILNLLARNIALAEDTTGVAVLQVTKKNDLIYIQILYNSLTAYTILYKEIIKDSENRLPDRYSCLVPVYFYFDMRNGMPEKPPAQELITEAKNQIGKRKTKFLITEPLKITTYAIVH